MVRPFNCTVTIVCEPGMAGSCTINVLQRPKPKGCKESALGKDLGLAQKVKFAGLEVWERVTQSLGTEFPSSWGSSASFFKSFRIWDKAHHRHAGHLPYAASLDLIVKSLFPATSRMVFDSDIRHHSLPKVAHRNTMCGDVNMVIFHS